jgi:hypothetical protein
MATTRTSSKRFSLDRYDLGKGLIMAIGGAVAGAIETSIKGGGFPHTAADWQTIGFTALAAGLTYLVKNFFTPAQKISPAE